MEDPLVQAGVAETLRDLVDGASSNERLAGFLMAAGVALLCLILLRRLWRRGRRQRAEARAGGGASVGARLERAKSRGMSREQIGRESLERLMVEVQELTRLCAAQMENRALRLERMIREADERISRLEGMEGGGERARHTGARTSRDEGRGFAAQRAGGGGGGEPRSLLLDDEMDPLTRRVYEFAEQGLTPVEIAGRLEEQVGKVELILALRGH